MKSSTRTPAHVDRQGRAGSGREEARGADDAWVRHLYRDDVGTFARRHAHAGGAGRRRQGPARVQGSRATLTYGAHPYWAKKPHELAAACLQQFTRPGDLVLDPFAGSGSVPLLASALGRPAIALDRSPAAAFIVDATFRAARAVAGGPGMPDVLAGAAVAELYATRCHRCGGAADMQYAVWSDLVACGACGEIWTRSTDTCHTCGTALTRAARRVGERLLEVVALCRAGCTPARHGRRADDRDVAARRVWRRWDVPAAHRTRRSGAGLPRMPIPSGLKTAEALARGIRRFDQLHTARNAVAMARVRAAIAAVPDAASAALRLAWHAALIGTSLKAQHVAGGGGYLPGMYYVPPLRKERNVAVTLTRIAGRVARASDAYARLGVPAPLHVSIGDARDLTGIPRAAVDYVFLDPPYDAKVQFAELNLLWEAWLGVNDPWQGDDLVVNRLRGLDQAAWQRSMARVAQQSARVLKPGAWLSLTYVPSARAALGPVLDAFRAAGLIRQPKLDGVVASRQGTYAQRTSRATRLDRVWHFQRAR